MSATESSTAELDALQSAALYNTSLSSHSPPAAGDAASSLKRPASPNIDEERRDRKRKKEEMNSSGNERTGVRQAHPIDGQALVNDLAQELQCGCCAGLVYKPVVVVPCDHFFCGSCCTLWVKNGGTNCPACRSVSTAVMPSRPLQSMVDVLLRAAPHLQRAERERIQADEIYPVLRPFRIPVPREPSPEPVIPPASDFVQPCPHCPPSNPFHWSCPQPIADPVSDPDNAWRVDAGAPPGHAFCGNCEVVLALRAPPTTRCDFCQVAFCGINVQGRCIALPVGEQVPHGMGDIGDLIQSPEIYECFEGNTTEVEIMLDYMTTRRLSPKQIYTQIVTHIRSQPEGFRPLIEQDLFADMHSVPGGTDPEPNSPRRRICRLCATEVFLYGLRDWWVRERRKAVREGKLADRRDCPDGASCSNMSELAHAKEFNHLLAPEDADAMPQATASTSSASSTNLPVNREIPPPATSALFLPPIASGSPRRSSADLPSISNLVAGLTRTPRFNLPNDLFSRFVVGPDERRAEQRTSVPASSVDLHPVEPLYRNEGNEAQLELTVDDDFFAQPSSSQSRRSVEAHLTQNLLAEYGSEADSDTEDKRVFIPRPEDDVNADARLDAFYSEALARAETNLSDIRRSHSPFKIDSDLDVALPDGRPDPSAFVPFDFLRDLTYGPTEAEVPPASNAYPVQVE